MKRSSQYTIPDTLRNWPWPRRLNPHGTICEAEATAWCESCHAFTPKSQKAFNRCNFSLLGSLAYPLLSRDGLRIACDLMNMFFVVDEYSDVATKCEARVQADIVMDALRNPLTPRPKGEWVGGEVTRQFWANAIKTASPSSQRRFVRNFQLYVDAVVQQADDRNRSRIRDIKSYFVLRRKTIGAIPSIDILAVDMDLPDEILAHPIIVKLRELCVDMILIGNDLYSYNVEQARGDDTHNIIRIVKNQHKSSLSNALKWIGKYHDGLVHKFLEYFDQVPSFGAEFDDNLRIYMDGLGNWVRANEEWSFQSERYFGTKGLEIKKTRVVDLLPNLIVTRGPTANSRPKAKGSPAGKDSCPVKETAGVENDQSQLPAAAGIIIVPAKAQGPISEQQKRKRALDETDIPSSPSKTRKKRRV